MSVIRCLPGSDPGCILSWDSHYSASAASLTRATVDYISVDSDRPFSEIRFFIRPCASCAVMLIRGARLVVIEQQIKDGRYPGVSPESFFEDPLVHPRGHHLTKADSGYSSSDYSVDRRFTAKTAPIYVSAIRCAALSSRIGALGVLSAGIQLEQLVQAEIAAGHVLPRYDALEFFEWSAELSLGNLHWPGVFSRIGASIPDLGRVACRYYNATSQLWAHPFHGKWASMVDNLQSLPFTAEELVTVYRTYTVNGVVPDRTLRYLAPDCFAHTGFTVGDIIKFAQDHAEMLRVRVRAQARDEAELAALEQFFGIDATLDVVSCRSMTLNSRTVFKTRLFD
ncbi:hypothetical protein C8J57DRAFT_1259055 [Mycena rebaudengoi]|nr:hypothetical protein C8J57DRAFT_1259055 [Mycena rebaudengoi]